MEKLGAKLSQKAFEEVQKSAAGKGATSTKNDKTLEFTDVMQKLQNGDVSDIVKTLGQQNDLVPGKMDIKAVKADAIDNLAAKNPGEPTPVEKKISEIVGSVNDDYSKLNRIMDLINSGQQFTPSEMFSLQTGVYTIVQQLELVSKVTQEANTGLKGILQTNL